MAKRRDAPSVLMQLKDMLYVNYLVPQERLAGFLPGQLRPAVVDEGKVFLSLVIFKGNTAKAFGIPAPPIPFDQVNIRTYVVDPYSGKTAVYFIKCGIRGRFVTFMYKTLSGMPVEHCLFRITAGTDGDGNEGSYRVEGNWHGRLEIAAVETCPVLAGLEPFGSVEDALQYLTDPLTGFYHANGGLRRLEIFHEPLKPKVFRAKHVDFTYLEGLGLLGPGEIGLPHDLLMVPSTPFEIFLPPRAVELQPLKNDRQ